MAEIVTLKGRYCDVVVALSAGVPTILHWGAPISTELSSETYEAILGRPVVYGSADVVPDLSVVPEHGSGHTGRPGLAGHRTNGTDWAPRFTTPSDGPAYERQHQGILVNLVDEQAELSLVISIQLDHALVMQAKLTNLSSTESYTVDALVVTAPIPQHANEIGSFTGRWTREFQPVRMAWDHGSHLMENRRGRTSHEHPPVIFAGVSGFSEWSGSVWGAHLAWSGNHSILAERIPDGRRYLQLGELLHPGEVILGPAESYTTPELIGVHSDAGLTAATQQFHQHLRSRDTHPSTARPVIVNTWEAVYFNHDLETLRSLADRAARIGAERFVLDDGWFGSRRDDRSGLGDWVVSADAHPKGLGPIIDHVRKLGMEFGIWIEPEMVNPDSDLYRAHPDWALHLDQYQPVMARNQLVLDLGHPEAFDHVFNQISKIFSDYHISYAKWDMNRDHIGAAAQGGAAGTHAQTLAVYRLIDELRNRHPGIEIESCSSGGARVDHEILRRTERVWTSDCNDALERQTIQRGASMLIPPEVMGAHIGPSRSHTTGRVHSAAFRAATAIFGHLGVEWNLLSLSEAELDALAGVVSLHRELRPLLHSGDVVRFDTESAYVAHGVYSADRSEAVVSFAMIATANSLTPPPLLLPGLDPARIYCVEALKLAGESAGPSRSQPQWTHQPVEVGGGALGAIGLQPPAMHPETAILIRLTS